MERVMLSSLAAFAGGLLVGQDVSIEDISTDSRKISTGALFVPLVGETFDGHDFIATAIAQGAAAVVSARREDAYDIPAIYVDDTGAALLALAQGYRAQCSGKVVGVTGSVGKTTTKDMLHCVLAARFRAEKTEGNLNNEIGVPLTLFRMRSDTEVMVCEMGMNHAGELSRISKSAAPNLAVITNIGISHIAHFGSREGILRAKLEILDGMPQDGTVVLCADDALLWDARDTLPVSCVTYGVDHPDADLMGTMHPDGSFTVTNRSLSCDALPVGGTFQARISVPGKHNVLNALACTAVALLLGETTQEIIKGLAEFTPSGLRQNRYDKNGFHIFADCYNASPDAMDATLGVLAAMQGTRFAVLGSMLELGAHATEAHRETGARAASCADVLCAYGPNADDMVQGAQAAGLQHAFAFASHTDIVRYLKQHAKSGDSLLFKGSRGMKMEQVLEAFLEGDRDV